MQAVIDVVLPVFGIIFAGFLAGRFRILGTESSEALNRFVYFFALPAVLALGMARVPAGQVFNLPFIAAFMGGVIAVFVMAMAAAHVAFPGRLAARSLGGLSAVFANTGYMGIPLFLTAFGPEGTLPAVIATVLNSAIVIGGAIVLIELDLTQGAGLRKAAFDVTRALVTNPLVIAPVAGLVWGALHLPIPKPLATFGDLLGASAGPCALFAIGLFLATRSLTALMGGRRAIEVTWLMILKLVVQPLVTWWLARHLGLDPFWTASAVILAALPTGALAFVIASRYGIYVERTSAAILGSSLVSVVTLSAVMIALGDVRP
ncbi:MAG TPA: AEC family transporter [Alphaproteobacteria bacterium]